MSAQLQVEVVPVSAATTVAILALDANFTDTLRTAVFTASAAKLFPGKSLTSTDVTDNLKESDFKMGNYPDDQPFGRFFLTPIFSVILCIWEFFLLLGRITR